MTEGNKVHPAEEEKEVGGSPDKNDQNGQNDQNNQSDQNDQNDHNEQNDQNGQNDQNDHSDPNDQSDQSDQNDQNGLAGKSDGSSSVNLRVSIPLASALARRSSHGEEDTVPSTPSWHSSRKTSLESMQYDA